MSSGGGEHETRSLRDPEIDFAALATSFDTMLLGRKTYEAARQQGGGPECPGSKRMLKTGTVGLEYDVP